MIGDGWSLRALVRDGSDESNLTGLELELVRGDLLDPHIAPAMRGCDAVFHCAAHYSLWQRDRDTLYRSNVLGTRAVLGFARAAGVPRVVYTSSVAAIGVKHGAIADERYQAPPGELIGAYKRSKYLAERAAFEAAAGGQDVVIVNPTTPLGPWDRKPTPTGEILVRFLNGRMPAYVDTALNWVAVGDVAAGHLLAYEKGRSGERYILGGENFPLHELLRRLGALTGRRPPQHRIPRRIPLVVAWVEEHVLAAFGYQPTVPLDGVRMSGEAMYYDSSKATRDLGYRPGPLEPALRAAIAWFAENGYIRSN